MSRPRGEAVPRRQFVNRLNDLSPREWIKFQKSWFVLNPPRRDAGVLTHPGKFPEALAEQFITFFTKRGQRVLDPMAGTGSTLFAALATGREAVGVELNPAFAAIAQERLARLAAELGESSPPWRLLCADARALLDLDLPQADYCLTSPPYWDMLRRKGFEGQRERRARGLPLAYSDDAADLGNIADYDRFVQEVGAIFDQVHALLRPGAYLTVVVKNVKKGNRMYPLAWDLARRLGERFTLKDERIWLQDDQRLAPYGMFHAWVSNTHHPYCLNFRKERERV